MSDVTHLPPMRHPRQFGMLMFGCCAAPIFWLGQLTLSYWVSAQTCFGSDHPTVTDTPSTLHAMLVTFDVIAIAAALFGGIISLMYWRAAGEGETRDRFMAIWGIFSSLCFTAAIIFNIIASVTVPVCAR